MIDYDVVLLDFDGTLLDTRESLYPVFKRGFEAIGRTCSKEEAAEFMHHSLEQAVIMAGIPKEEVPAWGDAIMEALDSEESFKLIKIFPDTKWLLGQLKELGIKTAIVTGNTSKHVRKVLSFFDMGDYFDVVIGHDEYKNGKPDGEPCLTALKALGVAPSNRCVYIGDSMQDIGSGHNAGIEAILIDRNNAHPDFKGRKIKEFKELFH